MRQTSIIEYAPHNAQAEIEKLPVLDCTFHHIKGIGLKTEAWLWKSTITHKQFLATVPPKLQKYKHAVVDTPKLSVVKFFSGLEKSEQWRIFNWSNAKIGYLDIETTGWNHCDDNITSAAVHSNRETKVFLACKNFNNMDTLPQYLHQFDIIVTFSGKSFDIPFIKTNMQTSLHEFAHIDVHYLCKGGLKKAENTYGLPRRPYKDMGGVDAILLFQDFENTGNVDALRQLIAYNVDDVIRLPHLLTKIYNERIQKLNQDLNASKFEELDVPDIPLNAYHTCESSLATLSKLVQLELLSVIPESIHLADLNDNRSNISIRIYASELSKLIGLCGLSEQEDSLNIVRVRWTDGRSASREEKAKRELNAISLDNILSLECAGLGSGVMTRSGESFESEEYPTISYTRLHDNLIAQTNTAICAGYEEDTVISRVLPQKAAKRLRQTVLGTLSEEEIVKKIAQNCQACQNAVHSSDMLDLSTKVKSMRLGDLESGGVVYLDGKVDAFDNIVKTRVDGTQEWNGEYLLEVKRRSAKPEKSIKDRDRLQLEAYLRLYNVSRGAIVQEYNSDVSADWIEKDDDFWKYRVSLVLSVLENYLRARM